MNGICEGEGLCAEGEGVGMGGGGGGEGGVVVDEGVAL